MNELTKEQLLSLSGRFNAIEASWGGFATGLIIAAFIPIEFSLGLGLIVCPIIAWRFGRKRKAFQEQIYTINYHRQNGNPLYGINAEASEYVDELHDELRVNTDDRAFA